jgi:MFS-type transporter involved in bile tolerance (Atg22 family)
LADGVAEVLCGGFCGNDFVSTISSTLFHPSCLLFSPSFFDISSQFQVLDFGYGGCNGSMLMEMNRTVRAMMTENSTPRTQARAFSFFAFSGNVGIFLGPLIGMFPLLSFTLPPNSDH